MRLTTLTLALFPAAAFAAGSETDSTPTPSETTTVCTDGKVFDLATETCMDAADSTNDDSARMNDVRELAYEGFYEAALSVLDTLDNPDDTMALTYYGFTHRKAGRVDLGMSYYEAALVADPDNVLARSYMGQGYVEAGLMTQAQAQLIEIRMRGGRGTWAEASLQQAIQTGTGYSY